MIRDSRISNSSAEAISELTKDKIGVLEKGVRNLYIEIDAERLKDSLLNCFSLGDLTLTENKIGIYTRYNISNLDALVKCLKGYTVLKLSSFDTTLVNRFRFFIVPEYDNREFEFEKDGVKYKFKWSTEVLANLGIFTYIHPESNLYVTRYVFTKFSDYYTNVMNNTERVFAFEFGSPNYVLTEYIDYLSYTKYAISSGTVTETDLSDSFYKSLFEDSTTNKKNYIITKVED